MYRLIHDHLVLPLLALGTSATLLVGCATEEESPDIDDGAGESGTAAGDDGNGAGDGQSGGSESGGDDGGSAESGADETSGGGDDGSATSGSDDGAPQDDSGDGGTGAQGSLTGSVTRTADPVNGGVGDLYVAVFDESPLVNMEAALVGQALIEDVDMTAADAVATYSIEGIPARPEPYFVVAFLDDNGTASTDAPGPDMGDLVSLEGTGAPEVVVVPEETTAFNIVLNAVMPF